MTDRSQPFNRRPGFGPSNPAGPTGPAGPTSAGGPNAPGADPRQELAGRGGHGPDAAQIAAIQAAIDDAATQAGTEARAESQAQLQQLATELEAARLQTAEMVSALQRERAEFQNFRRRTTEEREREAGLAADYLLKKVLSIADDFDRAIDARPAEFTDNAWVEGIGAIDRKLRGLLESEGVRPIDAVGKPFDPREHEAIASIPATGRPDGEVVAEIQRGYRVRDRILRPVLVAVAAGGPGPGESPGGNRPGDAGPSPDPSHPTH